MSASKAGVGVADFERIDLKAKTACGCFDIRQFVRRGGIADIGRSSIRSIQRGPRLWANRPVSAEARERHRRPTVLSHLRKQTLGSALFEEVKLASLQPITGQRSADTLVNAKQQRGRVNGPARTA